MAPPPRPRRLTWIWLIVGLVVVVGLIWWFIVPHGGAESGTAARGRGRFGAGGPPTTVVTGAVAKGDMPVYLNALGAVTPLATVTVQPQIAGYIQSIAFKEGQMVKKGQLLAQIDDRLYRAQLLSAQGSLAKDQAALADARLDLKRYQTLLAQDSIASQQVDTQAALVKQDEGAVGIDEAAINTAKLDIAYCHIVSPVNGRVGLRQVDVGNYVTSGLANGIVIVTEIAPIDVEFALPEDNLPQVSARIHAGAKLPVVATDRTGTTQLATGQLLTLDNQVDSTTGTIKAKARFDNGSGSLFPQQFVNVRVLVDTLHNAVIAPSAAVLRGSSGLYAFVVQGGQNQHKVSIRNITIGPAAGEKTAILSGLNPGDVVVTDGSDRLVEGARVILPGDCIPSMRPGGGAKSGGYSGAKPAAGAAGAGGCPAGQRPAGAPNAATLSAGAAVGGGPGDTSTSAGPSATPTSPVSSPAINAKPGTSAASSAAPAGGQGDSGQGGGGTGGRMQALLSQLNLDAAQQAKAQALFEKARGDAMAAAANAGDDPDAQRNARRQAMAQAFAGLEPILRADQKAKLAQLRAQMAQGGGQGGYQGGGGQP
jgi:multidrug efflux system membrane fusion protein